MKRLITIILAATMLVQTTTNATIWQWCAKKLGAGVAPVSRIEKVAPEGIVLTSEELQAHAKEASTAAKAIEVAQQVADLQREIDRTQADIAEQDLQLAAATTPAAIKENQRIKARLENHFACLQKITPAEFAICNKIVISAQSYKAGIMRIARSIAFPLCIYYILSAACDTAPEFPRCYRTARQFSIFMGALWTCFQYLPHFTRHR